MPGMQRRRACGLSEGHAGRHPFHVRQRPSRIARRQPDTDRPRISPHCRISVWHQEGLRRGQLQRVHRRAERTGRRCDASSRGERLHPVRSGACSYLDNARIVSHRCKTNTVSKTAFRGFGGPQGMMGIEYVSDDIARHLGLDPLQFAPAEHQPEKPDPAMQGVTAGMRATERTDVRRDAVADCGDCGVTCQSQGDLAAKVRA
jgi:hypothetical protein